MQTWDAACRIMGQRVPTEAGAQVMSLNYVSRAGFSGMWHFEQDLAEKQDLGAQRQEAKLSQVKGIK